MAKRGPAYLVEAPCRADLSGGTLDIWPLGMLHPGSITVNAAIPVMVRMDVDLRAPEGEVWHAVGDAEWTHLDESVATTDLSAAVAFAVARGATRIDGHPKDASLRKIANSDLFVGSLEMFLAAGFTEVERRNDRPVVRLEA